MWTLLLWLLSTRQIYQTLALYEQCNHQLELQAGQKIYINSPYYPGEYPTGSSCRYTVKAPADHVLSFKCELQLKTASTDTRCRTEVLHFNAEGDELLTSSEYFCGNGQFERKSFLNRAVISYISERERNEVYTANLGPKLKDSLPSSPNTTTTTSSTTSTTTTTTTSTTASPVFQELEVAEEEPDYEDQVLHVLHDAGVSDALAYMAALLYNEPTKNNGRPIATTTYLDQLPKWRTWRTTTTKRPKTSVKRAKIVSEFATTYLAGYPTGVSGGGRFSCLVEALAPICECGWTLSLKIASPTEAEAAPNEFPAMAGVLTKRQGKIFCGATIIHQRYLLSAAHCFTTPETNRAALLRIVVGEHDLSSIYESLYTRHYDLEALLPHEQFARSDSHLRNDIAVLRTRLPIVWSRRVGPACLPLQPLLGKKLPLVGQQVQAAGWGTTSFGGPQTQRLLKTTLDVIDAAQCRRSLQTGSLPAHSFCTYTAGRDTCQYDSGGALYERRAGRLLAVGIVSYGFACATQQPSVNTRVASFIKWIRSKTPEVTFCAH